MLYHNTVRKRAVEHFAGQELFDFELFEHQIKILLYELLFVCMHVDHFFQGTSLVIRQSLDIVLITAVPFDVSLVVVSALVLRNIDRLFFGTENSSRSQF